MSKTKPLHSWDVTCQEAVVIQKALREKLILCDRDPVTSLHWIAGADISYSRGGDRFFGVVVIFSYPSMEIVETSSLGNLGKSIIFYFPYFPVIRPAMIPGR
jgi:deoxyribonuclease V